MGVIHKLKQEVVDYILQHKKDHPEISCRKLSEVVSQIFQTKVSKSSISMVLQEAALSSPVGRRGQDEDNEVPMPKSTKKSKFKIPEQRKKEIFPESKSDITNSFTKPALKPAPVIKPVVTVSEENVPKVINREMSNLKSKQFSAKDIDVKLIDKAGLIFLKATEWRLAGDSVLSKVIQSEYGDLNREECAQAGHLLFFMEMFGIKDISEIKSYYGQGLWVLSDLKTPSVSPNLQQTIQRILSIKDFGLKAEIELQALFPRVSCFKLMTEDQRTFYIDAKSRNISIKNVQSEKGLYLTEAIQILTESAFLNVQSAVFHYASLVNEENEFEIIVETLFKAFAGLAHKKIKEISLLNDQGVELAKYQHGFEKKRSFVLAVFSWAVVLPGIAMVEEGSGIEELDVLGRKVFYQIFRGAAVAGQMGDELKAQMCGIALSFSSTEKPFVVLVTNQGDDLGAIKKAVSSFLLDWPELMAWGEPHGVTQTQASQELTENCQRHKEQQLEALSSLSSVEDGTTVIRQLLNGECQEAFFNLSDQIIDEKLMMERFYDLPGHWQEEENLLKVVLVTPADYNYRHVLENAALGLNHHVIRDPHGRRVVVELLS